MGVPLFLETPIKCFFDVFLYVFVIKPGDCIDCSRVCTCPKTWQFHMPVHSI